MNLIILRPVFIVLLISFVVVSCSSETPEQQIEKARTLFDQRQYRSAVIELKKLLKNDEKNVTARKLLGNIYLELGDGLSSEKEFLKFISYGGSEAEVSMVLAQSLLLAGQHEKLVKKFTSDQFEEPEKKAAIASYLGEAYLGLRKYKQAKKSFEHALQFKPDYRAAELGLAWVLINKQDWKAAEGKLKNLTENYPDYRDAWTAQAGLYRLQQRLDEAIVSYKKAIEIDGDRVLGPKSYAIRVGLIQALLAVRNTKSAEVYINTIADAYPKLPLTFYYQGLLAYLKKDYELASNKFYDVTKSIPDYMPPYMLLGAIHYVNGNYEQANVSLTRYVRSVPSNIEARKLLAAVHVKLNQNEEAFDVLAPVLSSEMSDNRILGLLGEMAAKDTDGEQAIRTLMQAAKDNPDNAAIGNTLALAYIRNAKYDDALTSLHLLGESADTRSIILQVQAYLHKSDIVNARKLARSLYNQSIDSSTADTVNGIVEIIAGQPAEAGKLFKKAADASPGNITARFYLARLAVSNGHYKHARDYFMQILAVQETYVPAYIGLAQLEQQQGDSEQSLIWLKQAADLGKGDISPTLLLANYYIEKKDINNARLVLTASRIQFPVNEYRDMLEARVYQLVGDDEETTRYYKRLLIEYPDNSQVYIEFAAFLSKIKQTDMARSYLLQAIKIDPESLRLQSALSLVTLQQGNADQALKIAEKIQADDQGSSVGFILAGDIFMSKARYEDAKKSYQKALDRKSTRKILYKLLTAYNALGEKKESQRLIESWINDHPEDWVAMFDHANILLFAKEWEKAIEQYQSILKLSPNHVASLNNMAMAYLRIDQVKALQYAKQAYELDKSNPALQDTLGWVYLKTGNLKKALLLLEKAAASSSHPSIKFHLASAYANKGDKVMARELLETILESGQYFEERKEAETLLKRLS